MKSPTLLPLAFFLLLTLLPLILAAPLSVAGDDNLEAAKDIISAIVSRRRLQEHTGKRNLNTDSDLKHIDFNQLLDPNYADENGNENITDSFLGLVSDGLEMLKDYIHSTPSDNESENENLGINVLLDGLLDEDGYVVFEIRNGYWLDLGPGSAVNLTSVALKGLDTFREADLLRPTMMENETARATAIDESPEAILQNSFVLETLVLDLYLTEINGKNEQELSIRLPFSGVAVSEMPLLLALYEEGLKNFPLGAALNHTNRLMPCLKETVMADASILALEATFEEVGAPSILASADPEADSPFFSVVNTLFVSLPAAVPIFFNSTIRNLLNDILNNNLVDPEVVGDDDIQDPCYSYPQSNAATGDNDLIDFRSFFDAGLPAMLMNLLEEQLLAVDPDTGLPKINEVLIAPMIESMADEDETVESTDQKNGATLVFGSGEEGLVDFDTNIAIGGLSADIELRVSDLKLYNIDTMVPPLKLLETLPQRAHQLNNTMTMGLDLEEEKERSMGLSAEVFFSILTDDSGSIEHNLRIEANMEALSLALTAMLEVVKSRLYGFPLKDIMNLQCWLATLRVPTLNDRTGIRIPTESYTAGIADLKASLARMNVDVTCLGIEGEGSNENDCGSIGMEEWVDIMTTTEAQAGATESMNLVLAYAASLLSGGGAILQTPIDRILNEAPMQCPHHPNYNLEALLPVSYESVEVLPEHEYSYEYLILWGSIALALIVAFAVTAAGIRCSVRRKNRRWLASTSITSEDRSHLARQQQEKDDIEEGLNDTTRSMFCSREIPVLVRWGMPLVVLGNIALFLSGHLNLGATVYIEANLAGETIKVDDFFDFAIARTTIDMWKAGGKSLAILILVFSGVWPYTKQILTLILWFLPTSWMSISTRGTYLIWIDRLAKWSMIDIFVIVVCIASFRVSIMSPEVAFLPENFYSVDLLVVPMWGLYSNMTAQIVSQISSHFIIYYHRCIVKKAMHALQQDSQSKQKAEGDQANNGSKILLSAQSFSLLWAHSFSNPHVKSSEELIAKSWVSTLILILGVWTAALVVFGSFFPSFSVEILGIIGIAVESGQEFEEAITRHSVWSIVNMLFEQAGYLDATGDYIGVGIMGALVLATVMVVPILQALGLIYQWFAVLTQNGRRRLSVVNEILQAWQYVEVYLIALFVASWQLGPISQYMFNSYCGSLDEFFAQMVSYGVLKEADAQCFSVQGSIDPGSISLLAAAILLAILNSVVTLANKQCLGDYGGQNSGSSEASGSAIEEEPVVAAKQEGSSQTSSGSSNPQNPIGDEPQDDGTTNAGTTKIRPFPVVFTDAYRWLLTAPTNATATATTSHNETDDVSAP